MARNTFYTYDFETHKNFSHKPSVLYYGHSAPGFFSESGNQSQSFAMFIQERGPSYRPTDLFDQLIDKKPSDDYETDSFELGEEIRQLREEFLINEIPNWGKTRDIEQVRDPRTTEVIWSTMVSVRPESVILVLGRADNGPPIPVTGFTSPDFIVI